MEFAAQLSYAYLEPFVAQGAEILSVAEPTTGDLISRSQFETFALPYLIRVVQRLKGRGVKVLVHICGNVTDRLDLLATTGADLLSVDYKVDLRRCDEVLGAAMAFAGNLNPVAVMQQGSPQRVAEVARACLSSAGASSSFVLMPGCDIPPTVPLENVQALVKAAHGWRGSPSLQEPAFDAVG